MKVKNKPAIQMRAIVYKEYGLPDVLKLKDVDKPIPGDNDVLIKVYASTVTTADVNIRGFVFVPPGLQADNLNSITQYQEGAGVWTCYF